MKNTKFVYSRPDRLRLSQLSSGLTSSLGKLWQQSIEKMGSFIYRLEEPKVQCKRDRFGETVWQVREPGNPTVTCHSEKEVRIWLDQRYYQ